MSAKHDCVHMNAFESVWTSPEWDGVHMDAFEWVGTPSQCDWVHMDAFKKELNALAIHKEHFWLLFINAIIYNLCFLLLTIIMAPLGLNTTFLEQCCCEEIYDCYWYWYCIVQIHVWSAEISKENFNTKSTYFTFTTMAQSWVVHCCWRASFIASPHHWSHQSNLDCTHIHR